MTIWQVRSNWTGPSGPLLSTMFFDVAAGGTPQQTADAVDDFWEDIQSQVSNQFVVTIDPEVRQFNDATGALLSVSPIVSAPRTMNGTGERLDLLQGLVSWVTGDVVNGRVLKGRTFIPGVMETMNEASGVPTAAYSSTIETACSTLIATFSDGLVVWHRPVNNAGGSISPVIAGSVNENWAYLSSRRFG